MNSLAGSTTAVGICAAACAFRAFARSPRARVRVPPDVAHQVLVAIGDVPGQQLQPFGTGHYLDQAVVRDENVFEVLMEAVRVCSLGQITHALFEVGGEYQRSM